MSEEPTTPADGIELVPTEDGSPTVFSETYREHYHNTSGAFLESLERYVIPCRIVERARAMGSIRILDVGFGLGFNLALAWRELRRAAPDAQVHIDSLEKDPIDPSLWRRLAAEMGDPTVVDGVASLLAEGVYEGDSVSLKLWCGGAEDTIDEVEKGWNSVFLDPFSPDRNGELWTTSFLRSLREGAESGAILSTYSAAVRVRVALLQAGWQIGAGPRVGKKSNGTLASAGDVSPPLPSLVPREARRLTRKANEWAEIGPEGPSPPPPQN